MKTQIVEVTNSPRHNWGKFLVGLLTDEWGRYSVIDQAGAVPILAAGHDHTTFLLLDLLTDEGALFTRPGRTGTNAGDATVCAAADLNNHQILVGVLYEPFLAWLYQQPTLEQLPRQVDLPDAPPGWYSYRRAGPDPSDAPPHE